MKGMTAARRARYLRRRPNRIIPVRAGNGKKHKKKSRPKRFFFL